MLQYDTLDTFPHPLKRNARRACADFSSLRVHLSRHFEQNIFVTGSNLPVVVAFACLQTQQISARHSSLPRKGLWYITCDKYNYVHIRTVTPARFRYLTQIKNTVWPQRRASTEKDKTSIPDTLCFNLERSRDAQHFERNMVCKFFLRRTSEECTAFRCSESPKCFVQEIYGWVMRRILTHRRDENSLWKRAIDAPEWADHWPCRTV